MDSQDTTALPGRPRAIDLSQSELIDHLKIEAQIHAQEARTANATIAEIYQIVTGSTGEPGNWNGAEPVRKCIEDLRARAASNTGEALSDSAIASLYQALCPNYDALTFHRIVRATEAAHGIRARSLSAGGEA